MMSIHTIMFFSFLTCALVGGFLLAVIVWQKGIKSDLASLRSQRASILSEREQLEALKNETGLSEREQLEALNNEILCHDPLFQFEQDQHHD